MTNSCGKCHEAHDGGPLHNPPRLPLSDILQVGEGTPKEVIAALEHYFEPFAARVENEDGKPICLNCGGQIDSFKQALGIGVAWEWGLVHGEARCSGCGWPGRGMHYIKDAGNDDIVTLRNVFLAYHPEEVTRDIHNEP